MIMMHKFGSISKEGFIEVSKEVFANTTIEIDFTATVAVKNIAENSEWVLSWTDNALAILDNRPVLVPGEEGLKDIKIVEAVYKSAAEGKKISLI